MPKIVLATSPLADIIDGLGKSIPHFRFVEFVPFLQSGERIVDGTPFLVASGEATQASLSKAQKQTPN
jgi:hypothetical protein